MSFVLSRIHGDGEVVKVLRSCCISRRVHHLVVVRRDSIEFRNEVLDLRKTIPIWDCIIDCQIFHPIDLPDWLVLTTDSNKLIILAFRQDLSDILIKEIPLSIEGQNVNLSILPNTLCVTSNFISFYTREGTLVLYDIVESNIEKSYELLKNNKRNKFKLFKDPKFYDISKNGLILESILPLNDKTFSILYKNDIYEYFNDFLILNENKLKYQQNNEFNNEISSILVPFENFGVFFFELNSISLKLFDSVIPNLELDSTLQNAIESTIKPSYDNDKCHFVSKEINLNFKISSSNILNDKKILFIDVKGNLYFTKIDYELSYDLFNEIDKLVLKKWEIYQIKGTLNPKTSFINQLNDEEFLFTSNLGFQLIKIDFIKKSFTIIKEVKSIPPILDFNITGTNIKKLQTVGANEFNSGFIKTEFKGYGFESIKKFKFPIDNKIINFWKINNIFIFNELFNFKIFDINGKELSDFKNISNINGSIINLNYINNDLIVVTDLGIFKNGLPIIKSNIVNSIFYNNEIIYTIKNFIIWNDLKLEHEEEISSLSAIKHLKKSYLLIGNWDGSVCIYINSIKKEIKVSNLAIKSVLIKKLGSKLTYIIGTGEGKVVLIDENYNVNEFKIGETPVDVIDFENSIICYNFENVIKFELNGEAKGYLKLDPENLIIKNIDNEIYCFDKELKLIKINKEVESLNNEILKPSLVKKSIKFKNHLNLSLFITINKNSKDLIESTIEIIENNTFKTKSKFKLDEGIEITDIINLNYKKEIIESYTEEDITIAYENVLSQCFIISCISHLQDLKVSSLKLITVDENGEIKYECSSIIEDEVNIYSLSNHCNRLVIGVGNVITCFKVEYSVINSKFSINKISKNCKNKFFINGIKSIGSDIIISDVIGNIKKFKLKFFNNEIIFKEEFEFKLKNFFNLNIEIFHNLIVNNDSLGNFFISIINEESFEKISQFRINDQINVIKKFESDLNENEIIDILNEKDMNKGIKPIFLLGSLSGTIYLISMVCDIKIRDKLVNEQNKIIKRIPKYEEYRKTRFNNNSNNNDGLFERFIDGDLLKFNGSKEIKKILSYEF